MKISNRVPPVGPARFRSKGGSPSRRTGSLSSWKGWLAALIGLAAIGTMLGQASGVLVYYDANRTGDIAADAPSQLLPASHLVLRISPDAFPDAASFDPVVIRLTLPPGAVLTQTLADGPLLGRPSVHPDWAAQDLAVGEFRLDGFGNPKPVNGSSPLATVGIQAVQLYRYVAGEHEIFLRVNESTLGWAPLNSQNFLAVAIGLGADVWPSSAQSNWGSAGIDAQEQSFFYADLRNYDFGAHGNGFPVTFDAFWQNSGEPANTFFSPSTVSLFTVLSYVTGPVQPVTSAVGHNIAKMVVADLDRDGLDDCCSIDSSMNRLYWAFGRPDNSMQDLGWIEVAGVAPRSLAIADMTGDARPDFLIGDASGSLAVVRWEDVFTGIMKALPDVVFPVVNLPLAGPPTDSAALDVDADGSIDYLYSDRGANVVRVLLGPDLSQFQTYQVGADPVAIGTGDFNADGAPDIAVANSTAGSVSVFLNDTHGVFSVAEVAGIGGKPVGIDTGDFDRDGRTDLAVAFTVDKSIGILRAQAGGQFTKNAMQKVFFQKTPSALKAENFDGLNGPDVMVGFADDSKLALCTSDAGGQLAYSYSINTLADVLLDPFNNVLLPEDSILSVAGGTTAGGVSSRTGVAAIQSLNFNILQFPRSQNISFAVVNLSADQELLNLELYDDHGIVQGSTTQTVPAGGQFARYFPDLLGAGAGQPDRWVRGFISQPDSHGIWLANNGADLTYLDGAKIPEIRDAYPELTFPALDLGGGHFTRLELINPSRDSAQLQLTQYSRQGGIQSIVHLFLGGRSRQEIDVAGYFPSAVSTDSIQLSADRPVLGVEMYGDPTSLACLQALPSGQASGPLYSPHVAVGDFGIHWYSRLTVVNSMDSGANVLVTLYNDSGAAQAQTTLSLPGRGKADVDLADLFSLTLPTSGYLVLNPQGAGGIVGHITFGDAAAGAFVSSLPLQASPSDHYLLGHIANGLLGSVDYYTGLAVLNPTASTQYVKVSAFDQAGLPLATRTVPIGPRSRAVALLNDFLPGLTQIFGGYVTVDNQSTAGGIYVFQLFGDWGFQFLSAVPAIPVG